MGIERFRRREGEEWNTDGGAKKNLSFFTNENVFDRVRLAREMRQRKMIKK